MKNVVGLDTSRDNRAGLLDQRIPVLQNCDISATGL